MGHYRKVYKEPEVLRKELRRESITFVLVFALCLAMVVLSVFFDTSTKFGFINRMMTVLVVPVLLPVSAFAVGRAWWRWRKSPWRT
ncbi:MULTISPECIES: hypothetical protein [Actinomadura]|uniref:Uncharacterized protein n=1 Tax=Actinomadura litoris TaxID=2678616 RepID=A0A7K1L5I5_9ACTN|nr:MULTISPECIES: hypothetical protein [Actinomadura]MBT2208449.1 hypothetical protein [Actinomadura sp. NEAU-AAG7]MUN39680.1 hypothetical protein [Actinomadura litoris]